ncbi:MAG: diguanylate cyclase [Pseudomonadota bacterium]
MPDSQLSRKGPQLSTAVSRLARSIMVVLCVLGVVAAIGHTITGLVIDVQEANATTVNVSGRQRMLSQRITLMAEHYQTQRSELLRAQLISDIDLFERSHIGLVQGDVSMNLPDVLPEVASEVYFGSELRLDARVKQFLELARRAAGSGSDASEATVELTSKAIGSINDRESLLYALDAAVAAFERHHRSEIRNLRRAQVASLVVFLLTLAAGTFLIARPMLQSVTTLVDDLDQLSVTDPMTDVLNRRGFLIKGKALISSAPASAVLVMDIDRFKRVNDNHGHAVGDACIRHVATIASEVFRSIDVFGRIGGEEYAAVLSGVNADLASLVAERLRSAVELTPCEIVGHDNQVRTMPMTLSVGVALRIEGETLEQVMQRADQALYEAKRSGRNRVVTNTAQSSRRLADDRVEPEPAQDA